MPVYAIDDLADARLDEYRNIPDPDLVTRSGLFVAEGRLVVRRLLLESVLQTRSVMVTRNACESLEAAFRARPDVPVYVVPQALIGRITGFNIHRGCLAVGDRPRQAPWLDIAAPATTIVALERVANADNVGGVFRNALAFGVGAVLLDPASTDPLYRKAIRTSMGASLLVPFARMEPWLDALHELRRQGVLLVALTPSAMAAPLRECAVHVRGRRAAIVLGHEGDGLTMAALAACDHHARIPMVSGVDSLNVASAAAIALYALGEERG